MRQFPLSFRPKGEIRFSLRSVQEYGFLAALEMTEMGLVKKPAFYSSIFRTAMKASLGTETVPKVRMRFLPSFCFSSSFFFRVMSPP